MKKLLLAIALIFLCNNAEAKCIVATDCTFEYQPVLISDGYSWDSGGLTLVAVDEIDINYKFDDDATYTAITEGNQQDTCPPPASGVCMTHAGDGGYRIVLDSLLIPVADVNKRLCIQIMNNATQTVANDISCQDVVYPFEGHVYCDISAATSTTSFTMASCVDSVGTALTLAADMFEGTIWRFYTNGTSACNVVDQKFYLAQMTGGGQITAGASGKLLPTLTPNTSNCGVTNP